MKECHPVEQNARQEELDRLYDLDGRGDKNHEHHCTYTGLYLKYRNQEGRK